MEYLTYLNSRWLHILLVVFVACAANTGTMKYNPDYNDGPVVIRSDKGLYLNYFQKVRGTWTTRTQWGDRSVKVHNPITDPFYVTIRPQTEEKQKAYYPAAGNIIVISDVEGDYKAFRGILEANNVINSNGNWIFRTGHLVMLGDLFDRGPDVSPLLWHLYKLEAEASNAGGRVHVLLGNHEIMIFNGDLRYIHPKYQAQMLETGISYQDRYGEHTVIGTWLRQKPAVISIGSTLFSHAGISPSLLELKMPMEEINETVSQSLMNPDTSGLDSLKLDRLYGMQGPFWYRGWVINMPAETGLDSILTFYQCDQMIVGHTLVPEVRSYYDGKLVAIDVKQKYGQAEQTLKALAIIEGDYFEIDQTGKKKRL